MRHPLGVDTYQWTEDILLAQLRASYFGWSNTKDLLGAYYRTRTFRFAHRELNLVRKFLNHDELDLGVRPLDHVRRLHLEIEPFLICARADVYVTVKDIETFRAALEAIADDKTQRIRTTVHINLAQDMYDGDPEYSLFDAANVVLTIARTINPPLSRGMKIAMLLEGGWDKSCGLEVCTRSLVSLEDCIHRIEIARSRL